VIKFTSFWVFPFEDGPRRKEVAEYILCQRKRNLPRIDVRICEARCSDRDICKDFQKFQGSREDRPAEEVAVSEPAS